MFKVRHKETGAILTVYALCGIMFLFHNGDEWYCDYMEHYEPMEVDDDV